MDAFQPLVNLLLLLSVLSVAAERVSNVFKLRRPELRAQSTDPAKEKEREQKITQVSLLICVAVALVVKADLFEIATHLDAPWSTLGWVRVSGAEWIKSPALLGVAPFLYTVGGCLVTALALGFGSKFWHDLLDVVYNSREKLKQMAQGASKPAGTP